MRTNLAWTVDYTPSAMSDRIQGVIRATVVAGSMEAARQRILTECPGVRVISCEPLYHFVFY